jgi:glyoxylase-like metal-dependent hydrolase (beta-lactamase superfamily II)
MSMVHEIIPVGPLQCNCSIVGDTEAGTAIVIDPGDETERILALLAKHGLRLDQIVITHAHIDHVGGATELKRRTGVPILMNEQDSALLGMLGVQANWLGMAAPAPVRIDQPVRDGDHIRSGSLDAEVIHTPGHTEGSICLLLRAANKLIAGDTLFAGGIGRTDLPGGSYRKIIESLHGRILQLPDEILVVPGHGPLTSIGRERESNPFLVSRP